MLCKFPVRTGKSVDYITMSFFQFLSNNTFMDELSKTGTEEFSDCNTVKTFSSYKKERARVRESHRNERKLYVGLFLSSCILRFTSIIIHKILN